MGKPLTDDEMLAQMNQRPLTDDEMAAKMSAQSLGDVQDQQQGTIDTAKKYGANALQGISKALGYVGGLSRTALSGYAGMINPNLVHEGDVTRAFKGDAPTTAEYLQRGGMAPGGSLSQQFPNAFSEPGSGGLTSWHLPEKGGPLDVTKRGAVGFAGDVLTDPTTYLTLGGGVAANAAKRSAWDLAGDVAKRPLAEAGEALGKKVYSGAFKNIDKDLVNKLGKPPLSPELLNQGFVGTMSGAKQAASDLQAQAGQQIGNTYAQAAKQGATVDMLPAMDEAMKLAAEMRKSPHADVSAAGKSLDELTMGYLEKGSKVPVDEAHAWASEANKLAGKRAFAPLSAGDVTMKDAIERAIGQGIQDQSMQSVKNVAPNLAETLTNLNKTYSATKHAEPSLIREVNKNVTKNLVSAIDGGLLGGAGVALKSGDPKTALMMSGLLVGKKAGQALNSTAGRTAVGQGLYRGTKYVAPVINQRSVWYDLNNNNQGENK